MPLQPKQQPPYYETQNNIKTYTALMSQTGTDAPTANIKHNTIGEIIWTRDSLGFYYGTLTGAFPNNKTAGTTYLAEPSKAALTIQRDTDNTVALANILTATDAYQDNFTNIPVTITVFP